MCSNLKCPHINQVIDEAEGSEVCTDCGLVLSNNLFVDDRCGIQKKIPIHINYIDKYHDIMQETCAKMHISSAYADKAYMLFKKQRTEKNKMLNDHDALAAYCIYVVLKNEDAHRSIRQISAYTDVSMKRLWLIEKVYGRLSEPINTRQIIGAYYHYFDLCYKDLKVLQTAVDLFSERDYTPNTLAASLIYVYCSLLKVKCPLNKAADVFNISTMSIHRCVKYLKCKNVNSILREL